MRRSLPSVRCPPWAAERLCHHRATRQIESPGQKRTRIWQWRSPCDVHPRSVAANHGETYWAPKFCLGSWGPFRMPTYRWDAAQFTFLQPLTPILRNWPSKSRRTGSQLGHARVICVSIRTQYAGTRKCCVGLANRSGIGFASVGQPLSPFFAPAGVADGTQRQR